MRIGRRHRGAERNVPALAASMVAVALLAAATLALASGCTSREAAPSPVTTAPAVDRALRLGEPIDLFAFSFEVDAIAAAPAKDGTPRIVATIRTRNNSDLPALTPDVSLTCKENREGGSWFKDSTWESNAILPPGVISEGELFAGLPPKPDAPTFPLLVCTDPMLRVVATRTVDRDQIVATIAVPDDVMAAAIAAV